MSGFIMCRNTVVQGGINLLYMYNQLVFCFTVISKISHGFRFCNSVKVYRYHYLRNALHKSCHRQGSFDVAEK